MTFYGQYFFYVPHYMIKYFFVLCEQMNFDEIIENVKGYFLVLKACYFLEILNSFLVYYLGRKKFVNLKKMEKIC